MLYNRIPAIFLFSFLILSISCRESYTPKPRGFMKVEYPEKEYQQFDTAAPFSFSYPVYAEVVPDNSPNAENFWYNILFPSFDATIYLSYKSVDNNLEDFITDSRTLAYKHTVKAESIEETLINRKNKQVYGLLYDFSGNTATALQFFLTDSSRHFLRGSLYFNNTPRIDSLNAVINFLREDIFELTSSFEWKDNIYSEQE